MYEGVEASGKPVSYREIFPTQDRVHIFVQHHKGVVPIILGYLKKARSAVKNEQKKYAKYSTEWNILESRQLGLKVSANSIYGFFGVEKGILPCRDVSESVTCEGREMILITREYVQNDFEKYAADVPMHIKSLVTKISVIYGDTDSVMIKMEGMPSSKSGVDYCLQVGKKAAKYITSKFPSDIVLEMEKVYFPYVLFNKKKYSGIIWMNSEGPERRDVKGLEVKKRDSWNGMRRLYSDGLDAILPKFNPKGDDQFQIDLERPKLLVLQFLNQVKKNELSVDDYKKTKQLKRDYSKAKVLPAHVVVRDKIAQRRPGSEPKSGNRVPFVIIEDKHQHLTSLRAEDPEYVKESQGKIKIDRLYYVQSLIKPISTLLEPCLENPEELFKECIYDLQNKRDGLQSIKQFLVKAPPKEDSNDGYFIPEINSCTSSATSPQEIALEEERKEIDNISKRVKKRSNNEEYIPKSVKKKKVEKLGNITSFLQK